MRLYLSIFVLEENFDGFDYSKGLLGGKVLWIIIFILLFFFIDRLINYSFQLSMNEVELNRMKKYTFFFFSIEIF